MDLSTGPAWPSHQEMVHEAWRAGGRSAGLRRGERAQSHRRGALPELGTAKGCPGGDRRPMFFSGYP